MKDVHVLILLVISSEKVFCYSGYVPRSCSEAPKPCSGTKKNYLIDPDGPGQAAPFTVECDFTTTPPATILHHNLEARTYVNGKEAAGGYVKTITYTGADTNVVKILVDNAERCTQFLKYECHGSVISNYGWFNDRDGNAVKSYFPGGNPSVGGCACYATSSCAKNKCNCDMNDNNWRKDEGDVERKSDLPITGVQFGDTGDSSEKGYHTVGPLKCYVTAVPSKNSTSAEQISSGKVLKSHTSQTITVPVGGQRMCALYCRFDSSCKSFSLTENSDGSSVCRLSTCDGENSLTTQAGGSYYIVYR